MFTKTGRDMLNILKFFSITRFIQLASTTIQCIPLEVIRSDKFTIYPAIISYSIENITPSLPAPTEGLYFTLRLDIGLLFEVIRLN